MRRQIASQRIDSQRNDCKSAKEVVEKQVVEEGCLVLFRKNCRGTRKKNSFPLKRCFSLLFFSVFNCGQYQGLIEKGSALQPRLCLPACGLPDAFALNGKAARYMYKLLGNWNSASWYVDKIMCTLWWRWLCELCRCMVFTFYTIVWKLYHGLAFIPWCGKQTVVLAI